MPKTITINLSDAEVQIFEPHGGIEELVRNALASGRGEYLSQAIQGILGSAEPDEKTRATLNDMLSVMAAKEAAEIPAVPEEPVDPIVP